jgi:hypothetical protein
VSPTKRWRKTPNILSQAEIDEFFGIINSYFGGNDSPIQKTKNLIHENQLMEKEIEEMKEIITSLRKENSNIESLIQEIKDENQKLKTEFQAKINQQKEVIIQLQNSQIKEQEKTIESSGTSIGFTDNHGIIHSLKQNPSNQILLSCSELRSDYPPENVFTLDNKGWWSTNKPNSWISIQFPSKKISVSGYLLRTYGNPCKIQGWKFEGSNDGINWNIIDLKSNQTSLT